MTTPPRCEISDPTVHPSTWRHDSHQAEPDHEAPAVLVGEADAHHLAWQGREAVLKFCISCYIYENKRNFCEIQSVILWVPVPILLALQHLDLLLGQGVCQQLHHQYIRVAQYKTFKKKTYFCNRKLQFMKPIFASKSDFPVAEIYQL